MRNFTHRWPKSGHFFSKLGHFFPIFEKGQGRPPPLVTRLHQAIKGYCQLSISLSHDLSSRCDSWFWRLEICSSSKPFLFTIIVQDTTHCTKNKFSITIFFSKSDPIRRKLRIWSHLLKKSLMENFIFMQWLTFLGVNMTSYFWNQFITFYKQQI